MTTWCVLCQLNGDLRPAKEPWEGFPTCSRCQLGAKVRARWFKSEMFKVDTSTPLARYAARRAFSGAKDDSVFLIDQP
jgi:hypothetical protein